MKRIDLTRDQKQALALMLWVQAGNLVEFWEERKDDGLMPLVLMETNADLVAEQMSRWLGKLPGAEYDTRLPNPDELG